MTGQRLGGRSVDHNRRRGEDPQDDATTSAFTSFVRSLHVSESLFV